MHISRTSYRTICFSVCQWIRASIIFFLLLFAFLFSPYTLFALIPNDPFFEQQWHLQKIEAPAAWDKATGNRDVIVAVIDAGIDLDHIDLEENLWKNEGEIPDDDIDNDGNGFVDDYYGWDFVHEDGFPNPRLEEVSDIFFHEGAAHHGTIVAGLIGAVGDNNEGVSGVNWHVRIMSLRAMKSDGTGDTKAAARAVDYAVQMGADIINTSVVGFENDVLLSAAIERAWDAGLVIVSAAGNDNNDLDARPAYPICHDTDTQNIVLGVAAVDQQDVKAPFSNYGASCIDLSAPGFDITSTQTRSERFGLLSYYGSGFKGTSFAAPLVSGAAALVKGAYPAFTNVQIRDLLLASVDVLDAVNPEYKNKLGAGRLNLKRLLERAQQLSLAMESPPPPPPLPPPQFDLLLEKEGVRDALFVVRDGEVIHRVEALFPPMITQYSFASGDIDGDGTQEIVTAGGIYAGPQVQILNASGELLGQFFAFEPSFRGGVNVSVGDVNGDGRDEIVVAPAGKDFLNKNGRQPEIRVFDDHGTLLTSFLAYAPTFDRGMFVATGDVDGDGIDEIVTGAAVGGGPHVRVFRGDGTLLDHFFAYDKRFRGGVRIAVGDVDGDGRAEVVTVPDWGGGPHVRIFDFHGNAIGQFFVSEEEGAYRRGLRIALADLDGNRSSEIIVTRPGGGKKRANTVSIFDAHANALLTWTPIPEADGLIVGRIRMLK